MFRPGFGSSVHDLGSLGAGAETVVGVSGWVKKPRAASDDRGDMGRLGELAVGAELMTDTTVVSVAGEIDLITIEQFEGALRAHLNDGARTVVLDLTEVSFVSVAGGRVLLTALHLARRRGLVVRVALSRAAHRIVTLLEAAGEYEAASA